MKNLLTKLKTLAVAGITMAVVGLVAQSAQAGTTPDYLTFTAEEDGSTVTFKWDSGSDVMINKNDAGWEAYTAGTTIPLAKVSDKVMFKGKGVTTSSGKNFTMTGKIAASGDVGTLTDGKGGKDVALTDNCYWIMFAGCKSLTAAPDLPATTLAESCYKGMFQGCTSLTNAPALSATTLAKGCCQDMFRGCTSLTTAPDLPATTLVESCYQNMFYGCESLTTAPDLPATTLAELCYSGMFSSCEALTTAPDLPVTALAECCYQNMFINCESLTTAPELPATTLTNYCYYGMFQGCTSLVVNEGMPGKAWSIPSEAASSAATATDWNTDMFADCGGDVIQSTVGKTYYIASAPTTTLEVTPVANTSISVYTNHVVTKKSQWGYSYKVTEEVEVAGPPYEVETNATVKVVYTVDEGYLYAGGVTTWTTNFTANALTQPLTIPATERPMKARKITFDLGGMSVEPGYSTHTWALDTVLSRAKVEPPVKTGDGPGEFVGYFTEKTGGIRAISGDGELMIVFGMADESDGDYVEVDSTTTVLYAHWAKMYVNGEPNFNDGGEGWYSSGDYLYLTNAMEYRISAINRFSGYYDSDLSIVVTKPDTTVILDCVEIQNYGTSPLALSNQTGKVTLKLKGCSNLLANYAEGMTAVSVGRDAALVIDCADGEDPSTCELGAWGGDYAAGIGGSIGCDGAHITINGGKVYAWGGIDAAGIGGGYGGNGFGISINGGYITANGGESGAGIGGGMKGVGSDIAINGGYVHAGSTYRGADVGNGYCAARAASGITIDPQLVVKKEGDGITVEPRTIHNCLTFSADKAFGIKLLKKGSPTVDPQLEYSTDKVHWLPFDKEVGARGLIHGQRCNDDDVTHRIYLRGTGNAAFGSSLNDYYTFTNMEVYAATPISCSGNIETLLDYETVAAGNSPTMGAYAFCRLFEGFTALATAPTLPATDLSASAYCYYGMFENCASLWATVALPATTLSEGCYARMFAGCTALKSPSFLPATTLAAGCYDSIFAGCTAMSVSTSAPGAAWMIPSEAASSAEGAANWNRDMFKGVPGDITSTTVACGVNYYTTRYKVSYSLDYGESTLAGRDFWQRPGDPWPALYQPTPAEIDDHMVFEGWLLGYDGVEEGDPADLSADSTLIGCIAGEPCYIEFFANGAFPEMQLIVLEYGDCLEGLPDDPERDSCTFKGWWMENGTTQVEEEMDWPWPGTTRVLAKWNMSLDGGLTAEIFNGDCKVTGSGTLTKDDAEKFKGDSITNLVIGTGVTGIGASAFENWATLRDVTIGADCTAIGAQVFHKCRNLTNVTCQATTAVTVGDYAFYRCSALDALNFSSMPTWGTQSYSFQSGIYMKDGIPMVYAFPTISISGYKQVTKGTNNLSDPNSWVTVTDETKKNYHFFKIVLEEGK